MSAGRTGYPIVDAAMRQLNQSATHNRRMVAVSFLVKDLHLDWAAGASAISPAADGLIWQPTTAAGKWSASTGW